MSIGRGDNSCHWLVSIAHLWPFAPPIGVNSALVVQSRHRFFGGTCNGLGLSKTPSSSWSSSIYYRHDENNSYSYIKRWCTLLKLWLRLPVYMAVYLRGFFSSPHWNLEQQITTKIQFAKIINALISGFTVYKQLRLYVRVYFGLLLLLKGLDHNSDFLCTLGVPLSTKQVYSAWHHVMPLLFFHSWRSRSHSLSSLLSAEHSRTTICFPVDKDRENQPQAVECSWSHAKKRIAMEKSLVTPCPFTPRTTPLDCPTPFSTSYQENTLSFRNGTCTTSAT